MSWTAIAAYIKDQVFAFQDANELRANIISLASLRSVHSLGGTRLSALRNAAFTAVPDYRHPKINGANKTGFTAKAVVEYRTDDTGTAVDWQVIDIDNADAVVAAGTAYSADTNWQEETQTITLNAGDHRYELQVKGSNADADVQALGRIEIYATA